MNRQKIIIDKNTFLDLQTDTTVKRGIALFPLTKGTYTFVRISELNYNLEHLKLSPLNH